MTLTLETFRQQLAAHEESLRVTGASGSEEQLYTYWKNIFGDIEPETVYKRIAASAPNPADASVQIDLMGKEAAVMQIQHQRPLTATLHGLEVHLVKLDHKPLGVSIERATLSTPSRGKNIGKGYLREVAALVKDLGAQKIGLTAGGDVGGYAWAKYGFVPTQQGYESIRTQLRIHLKDGQCHHYDRWIDISPEFPIIQSILARNDENAREHFGALTDLNRVVDNASTRHPLTVGKALLLSTGWEGELVLQDGHPGYERFKAYTDPERVRGLMA
jgi:hypothetical protein